MTHDKANLLGLLVAKEFAIANTSLLPLIVSETIELASDTEDAFFFLLTSDLSNLWEISLLHLFLLGISIVHVVSLGGSFSWLIR